MKYGVLGGTISTRQDLSESISKALSTICCGQTERYSLSGIPESNQMFKLKQYCKGRKVIYAAT